MRTIEINGLSFTLLGVFNDKPLYQTQLPYDSHFYYVRVISSRRYDISRIDINDNEEWLDEASTFEDAAQIILEHFAEPW